MKETKKGNEKIEKQKALYELAKMLAYMTCSYGRNGEKAYRVRNAISEGKRVLKQQPWNLKVMLELLELKFMLRRQRKILRKEKEER